MGLMKDQRPPFYSCTKQLERTMALARLFTARLMAALFCWSLVAPCALAAQDLKPYPFLFGASFLWLLAGALWSPFYNDASGIWLKPALYGVRAGFFTFTS